MSDEQLPPNAVSGRDIMSTAEEVWGMKLCCIKCYELQSLTPTQVISRPMFLCPSCGCKRCPKATDHNLDCTGSNLPGQPGSYYE
jgi:hypothetical protein